MFPKNIRYTETHEWIRLEEDVVTVGITSHAAEELGDITYVELPGVGEAVTAESAFGTIESVKATSDILAPVDGEVVEVNDALEDDPQLLCEEPYDDGWLVRLKLRDPSQIEDLMDASAYVLYVKSEAGEDVEPHEIAVDEEEDDGLGQSGPDENDEDPDEAQR